MLTTLNLTQRVILFIGAASLLYFALNPRWKHATWDIVTPEAYFAQPMSDLQQRMIKAKLIAQVRDILDLTRRVASRGRNKLRKTKWEFRAPDEPAQMFWALPLPAPEIVNYLARDEGRIFMLERLPRTTKEWTEWAEPERPDLLRTRRHRQWVQFRSLGVEMLITFAATAGLLWAFQSRAELK